MTPPSISFSATSLVLAFLFGLSAAMLGRALTSTSTRAIDVNVCGDSWPEDEEQVLRMGQKARVALGDSGQDITVEVAYGTEDAVPSTRDGNISFVRPRTKQTEVIDRAVQIEPIGEGNVVLVKAGEKLIQAISIATARQIELCSLHGQKQLGILLRDIPDTDLLRVGSSSPVFYEFYPLLGLSARRRHEVLILPVDLTNTKRFAAQTHGGTT